MNTPDDVTCREALELAAHGDHGDHGQAPGGEPPYRQARLDAHLAFCPDCADEEPLDTLLRRESLEVRPDFRRAVLAALPVAPWEGRQAHTQRFPWAFPAAACLLLGLLATAFYGMSAAVSGAGRAASALGAMGALAGLLKASALAGAGLLGASWKGLGMVLQELIAAPLTLGAFAVLVFCLNVLLVSLVRRRRTVAVRAGR
jgi:hypothetical protein